MIQLTAKLENLIGDAIEDGYLQVQLHAFGNQVPAVAGTAFLARTKPAKIEADGTGTVNFAVHGNDTITPAGTYYTVAVLDSNGTVIQVNAYRFTGSSPGSIDLSTLTPFDPTEVVPLTLTDTLVLVPYAPGVLFDGTAGLTFDLTLSGPLTLNCPTPVPGNLYTFILTQDGIGGHPAPWAATMRGGGDVLTVPGSTTIQMFVARSDGSMDAVGPVMYSGFAA